MEGGPVSLSHVILKADQQKIISSQFEFFSFSGSEKIF
jgi:hypothetical protein